MARPVNADAAETRRRILGAARNLVSEQGIDGTSMRDIARDSGVSLATVHHYYGSKEALHSACIEDMYRELEDLKAELKPAVVPGRPLKEALDDVVRRAFRFAVAHRSAQRLMQRTVIERGLDEERREGVLKPFLSEASAVLSFLTGQPTKRLRFVLQSLVYLNMRYSLATDEELCAVANVTDAADARAAVEDHLVDVALSLIGPEASSSEAPAPARGAGSGSPKHKRRR